MKTLIIGIDPGVNTGFAIKDLDSKRYIEVKTVKLHTAFEKINDLKNKFKLYVVVEDARKRKWFGKTSRERLQGAGSVKRDSKAWEDFLIDKKIPHRLQAPKATKVNPDWFKKVTYYEGRTSIHAREAGMIILPITENTLPMYFRNVIKNDAKQVPSD
jgi:hypothetical protein